MAKTIKFNLIMDEYPVRNISDLQEHFCIEDILKYYKNGLLLRWLNVRGFNNEYEQVYKIDKSAQQMDIAKELVKIFNICDENDFDIEKALGILMYTDQEKSFDQKIYEGKLTKDEILKEYYEGYHKLYGHMLENIDNMSLLKADAKQIDQVYYNLFFLDYERVFNMLLNGNDTSKAIYAVLTVSALKKLWLSNDNISSKLSGLSITKISRVLGDDLKCIQENTDGNWKCIEDEKKIMVIYMTDSARIRNYDNRSESLSALELNNKFTILKGLEYQSSNAASKLYYIEV